MSVYIFAKHVAKVATDFCIVEIVTTLLELKQFHESL